MSWASERLAYLSNKYSFRDIQEITGIPISTISYVISEQRRLPSKYILNLRSYYERESYKALREAGLTPALARQFRSYSVEHTIKYMQEANRVVNMLVEYRFNQYNEYLKKQGKYVSDDKTREILRSAIAESLGRSPVDTAKDVDRTSSPSIRHIVDMSA